MAEPEYPSDLPDEPSAQRTPEFHAETFPVLDSRDLFQGRREVLIDHQGSLYRLRLTRTGKLILHK